ncbi:hypothetical protein BKA65DRAFT_508063, partial [Rhexocercosporidium sp. MPI-PUGE-AT-0058]
MVKLMTIRQENARFTNEHHAGYVFVFAGATSGIGASTLERMATMVFDSTFYVIGRSRERFASQKTHLETLNPTITIIFIQAEFSLISDIDAVSRQIITAEKKVDYLFMSPGIYPLNGAEFSKEGLEVCFAVSYYSRIRLVSNLLPLLRQSSNPRVLSVLSGGRETVVREDDIGLQHNWASRAVISHTITMTSLAFDHLSKNDTKIAFIHSFPGLVRTSIFAKHTAPEGSGLMWRIALAAQQILFAFLMMTIGTSPAESGEMQAFILTADKFGPGVNLVSEKCEESTAPAALARYRDDGWAERIWEHTTGIFDKVTD